MLLATSLIFVYQRVVLHDRLLFLGCLLRVASPALVTDVWLSNRAIDQVFAHALDQQLLHGCKVDDLVFMAAT